MSISMKEAIILEDLDNTIFKRRGNNMLLSDYQISVLSKNGISYMNYSSYNDLLFDIEEILNENFDDELDNISNWISEYAYYTETKK